MNHQENCDIMVLMVKELIFDLQNIEFVKQSLSEEGVGLTTKPMAISTAQSKLKRVLAQNYSKIKKLQTHKDGQ